MAARLELGLLGAIKVSQGPTRFGDHDRYALSRRNCHY